MLQSIVDQLYETAPSKPLYHYTSLQGLLGIVRSKVLWASEVHYLNDAEELKCFANCINAHISQRLEGDDANAAILRQFREWLAGRMSHGPMLFTTSFTENGNLLSQWRGYCPPGKGVSIGFEPAALAAAARQALFMMGRCIYDAGSTMEVAGRVLDRIVAEAAHYAPEKNSVAHQSHYGMFQDIEPAFLQIAVLMKNLAFHEEQEWRLVSPVHTNYVEPPIHYREGAFSLVPYLEFALPLNPSGALAIRRTIVGPSPNMNLSIDAISRYLSKAGVAPNEIQNSGIPYRQT